jgi:hypothetical protein
MAGIKDFRDSTFSRPRVEVCGRYLGHNSYWKLYAIENYLRVIMHSVLIAQIPAPWWDNAVDKKLKEKVAFVKNRYAIKPTHTSPGKHDIYYAFLPDLNKIILANSNLFRSSIPDIDTWIPKIEDIWIPRNLVGHMNYPNVADRKRIDKLYYELSKLMEHLENSILDIKIP